MIIRESARTIYWEGQKLDYRKWWEVFNFRRTTH